MISVRHIIKKRLPAVLCAALFALVSCAAAHGADEPPGFAHDAWYTFTDDAGETVILTEQPEKIAVLTSSFAEIWQLAGGTCDITVGESVERGFADADVILVDAGAGKTINTELLIAAEPDFVIGSADIAAQAEAVTLLQSAGIPSAQMRVESFDDYLSALKIFTDITGNADAYRLYGEDVRAEIDAIFESLPQTEGETTKILFIRAGSGAKSTKAKTAAEHFACAMLDELGAYNIADNAPVLIDGLSAEEILREDPAILFISTMGDEDAAVSNMTAVLADPAWQNVRAVREGRVYYLPKELFQYKPNARWADAYRMLAEILYEE